MKTILNQHIKGQREKALWLLCNSANLLTDSLLQALDSYSLSLTQYRMLLCLAENAASSEIEELFHGNKYNLLQNLNALCVAGLTCEQNGVAQDDMQPTWLLTAEGYCLLDRITHTKKEAEKRMAGLTEFEFSVLNKLLEKLSNSAQQQTTPLSLPDNEGTQSLPLQTQPSAVGSIPIPMAEPRHRQ